MSIRRIGIADPEPQPELMSVDDVAARLGMNPDTVRRWIKADMADGGRRIPGGRCEGSSYRIIRAVFERAMRDGIEPTPRPTPQGPDLVTVLEAVLAQIKSA